MNKKTLITICSILIVLTGCIVYATETQVTSKYIGDDIRIPVLHSTSTDIDVLLINTSSNLGNATATRFAITNLTNCDTFVTDGSGTLSCGTDATAGSGLGSNWSWSADQTFLYPSTTVGILSRASSSIDSNFRIDGNATTTGSFYVGSNYLVVRDDGNVGVGTASPAQPLHVVGNIQTDGYFKTDGGTFLLDGILYTNQNSLTLSADNDGNGAGYIQFKTGSVEYARLDDSGNFGIGTTTPDQKLTVIGQIHASTTANQLKLTHNLEDSDYATFSVDANGDLTIDLATANSTTTFSDNLKIEGNATTTGSFSIASPYFVVRDNGNVGIGGTNPTSTLSVYGDLHVQENNVSDRTRFLVDASTGFVGIGTTTPESILHLVSDLDGTTNAMFSTEWVSPTPADNDSTNINHRMANDANESIAYAVVTTNAVDVSDASEDGEYEIKVVKAGSLSDMLSIRSGVVVVNEDSEDVNLRVETDSDQYGFFIDASTGFVGIGTSTQKSSLTVDGSFAVGTNGTEFIVDANGNATTTGSHSVGELFINSEGFTDLTGTGLQNSAGVLTLNATGDWTGTFDGEEGTYYLDWDNFTDKAPTSTTLSLLDSDYRIALLNASSSLFGSATTTGSLGIGDSIQFTTAGDNYCYFDNAQTNYFMWDDSADYFALSNDLNITGTASTTAGFRVNDTFEVDDTGRASTTGQLFVETKRISGDLEKCFTMASSTWATGIADIPLWHPSKAVEVTDVYCEVDSGTSIAITFSDGTDAFETITCDEDGAADDGSITNGTFTANERFEIDLSSITGAVDYLNTCIVYHIMAE